jgi:hypothetical protein
MALTRCLQRDGDLHEGKYRMRGVVLALVVIATVALQPTARADGWPSRAEGAVRKILKGNDAQVIANSVLGICHSSGQYPAIQGVDVTHGREMNTGPVYVKVQMTITWKGAFGGLRRFTVEWSFDRNEHVDASVVDDDAPVHVSKADAVRLNTYFRDKVFPMVVAMTNG